VAQIYCLTLAGDIFIGGRQNTMRLILPGYHFNHPHITTVFFRFAIISWFQVVSGSENQLLILFPDFYSTRSTEGVESTRGNSVCLSGCPSSLFPSSNIQWFDGLYHANHIFSENSSCWQPVPPCSDPVTPSTNQYWPSIQWFDGLDHVNQIFSESISHWQLIPACFDPVSPSTNQYHPILMQYHQVTTSGGLYRPSTTNYHLVLLNTDPVPPCTNKKCPLLTQCHQIPNSIWKDINLQIFSQLNAILVHVRGRVWPGLPVIFYIDTHRNIWNNRTKFTKIVKSELNKISINLSQ